MNLIKLTTLFLFCCSYAFAQPHKVTREWTTTLPNFSSDSQGIKMDNEDRIYVHTRSAHKLIRFTTEGDTLWSRDVPIISMDIDSNGDILTIGQGYATNQGYFWRVNKWDSTGTEVWEQILGYGTAYEPKHIECDSMNNIYATGKLNNHLGVVKLYPNGVEAWSSTNFLGAIGNDISIKDTNEIYVTGQHGGGMRLLKLNHLGDTIWTRRLNYGEVDQFLETDDLGNAYLQIQSATNGGLPHTVCFDNDGNLAWSHTRTLSFQEYGWARGLFIDSTGNIISIGADTGSSSGAGAYIEKRLPDGTLIWENYYNAASNYGAFVRGGVLDADDIYLFGTLSSTNGGDDGLFVFNILEDGTQNWFHEGDIGADDHVFVSDMAIGKDKMPYATGAVNPQGAQRSTTFKLFECAKIDSGFTFVDDTLWANTSEFEYQWLDCNDNLDPLTGTTNLNSSYAPSSLGSYTLRTEFGTCSLTADCLITGYEESADHFICFGDDFTFPDGTVETDIQASMEYYSYLTSTTGLDSIVRTNLIISPINIDVQVTDTTLKSYYYWAENYQWLDCANNFSVLVDDTNQIFYPSNPGYYAVEITNDAFCKDTSECIAFGNVSINSFTKDNAYGIFPNPVKSNGIIEIMGFSKGQFKIINSIGQIVLEDKFDNNIALRDISPGLYNIVLITSKKSVRLPLIIE